jgi:hypothetical protein
VLDEQDGDSQLIPQVADEIHHLLCLFGIHAGGGFVQEQELGAGGQGPGDFQPPLVSVGKVLGQKIPLPRQVHEAKNSPCFFGRLLFFLPGSRSPHHNPEKSRFQVAVEPDQHVLHHGEFGEEADILIGAGDPQTDDLVWQEAHQGMAVEEDLPLFRLVETGHAVKKSRLPRPVGTDDAVNALLLDLDVQLVHGHQAAEPFGRFLCRKNRHAFIPIRSCRG